MVKNHVSWFTPRVRLGRRLPQGSSGAVGGSGKASESELFREALENGINLVKFNRKVMRERRQRARAS